MPQLGKSNDEAFWSHVHKLYCGSSSHDTCDLRVRWFNSLCPSIKRSVWSAAEDAALVQSLNACTAANTSFDWTAAAAAVNSVVAAPSTSAFFVPQARTPAACLMRYKLRCSLATFQRSALIAMCPSHSKSDINYAPPPPPPPSTPFLIVLRSYVRSLQPGQTRRWTEHEVCANDESSGKLSHFFFEHLLPLQFSQPAHIHARAGPPAVRVLCSARPEVEDYQPCISAARL